MSYKMRRIVDKMPNLEIIHRSLAVSWEKQFYDSANMKKVHEDLGIAQKYRINSVHTNSWVP